MSEVIVIRETTTSNPVGSPKLVDASTSLSPLPADVAALQDPAQTQSDFLSDLDRATSNKAKEHLARDT